MPHELPQPGQSGYECACCAKRPGTIKWVSGGALDVAHGFWEWWCEPCALQAQLAHARQQAARIPELEQQLATAMSRERPRTGESTS